MHAAQCVEPPPIDGKPAKEQTVTRAAAPAHDGVEGCGFASERYEVAATQGRKPRRNSAVDERPQFANDAVALGKERRGPHAVGDLRLNGAFETYESIVDERARCHATMRDRIQNRIAHRPLRELGKAVKSK